MDNATLTKHAEAILRPLGYGLRDGKFVALNLPTSIDNTEAILTALRAAVEDGAPRWVFPKVLSDMPAKPGKEAYEYVECLVLHKGDVKVRPWNCEHQVFDNEDYDDHFCEWHEIEAYQLIPSVSAIRSTIAPTQPHSTEDRG